MNPTLISFSDKLDGIISKLDEENDILKALNIVAKAEPIDTSDDDVILGYLLDVVVQLKNGNIRVVYFSDNTIKTLKDIAHRTDKLEYSANLCAYKDRPYSEIFINYIRKGEKLHTIETTDKTINRCDKGKEIIAGFHTHPDEYEILPSPIDYLVLNESDENFECIGSKHSKDKLTCFVPDIKNDEELDLRDAYLEKAIDLYYTFSDGKQDNVYHNLLINEYKKLYNIINEEFYTGYNPEIYRHVIIIKFDDGSTNIIFTV